MTMRRMGLLSAILLVVAAGVFGQEAAVAPPESIAADGVPSIPQSLAETA